MNRVVKTGSTLPVVELEVPGCKGKIGLHPCPGKRQGSDDYSPMMEQDLQWLMHWGSECMVTLMEPEELARHKVESLGDKTVLFNMQWFHLPIPDEDLPDAEFEARWPQVSKRLNMLLDNGGNISLHCKGGTGRTGFIAARLLIERGMDKFAAEQLIKSLKPGALTMPCRRQFLGLDE
jgi:hypothetical protein